MKYLNVSETAKKWGVSEPSVRFYCSENRVDGAILKGKTWYIPEIADKPVRLERKKLLDTLLWEKNNGISGGIYHQLQVDLTFNSNHIEGSTLTHDQTRYIFETNTIGGFSKATIKVDDIVETTNHFRAIDIIIETANKPISQDLIKLLHFILKNGTSDSRKNWFRVGDYKLHPNQVGGRETTPPNLVKEELCALIKAYNQIKKPTLEDILEFHYKFEVIHPFQDGNGRIGRLIMLKECLKNGIIPFIIDESLKFFYYRGLAEWRNEKGYLKDTCLAAQDKFKGMMDYYKIRI
ncbi:MAG: Fic family protein [Clostridia bacterium]|nr:Fic family protein [Clostridia bacterium]